MPQGLFYLSVQHDDWCLIWTTNDPGSCNCQPDFDYTEVTDENADEVAKQMQADNQAAQKLLQGKRN